MVKNKKDKILRKLVVILVAIGVLYGFIQVLFLQENLGRKDKVMAGNVVELTDAAFDETVHNSDVPVLVDFWAPWCGPCKMIAPIIAEIANEYKDKAKICKLNTDEQRDSAIEFGISAIPTIILFKDGQVQKKWVGLTSKKNITAAIDELL